VFIKKIHTLWFNVILQNDTVNVKVNVNDKV
jgi:hypothetical protein